MCGIDLRKLGIKEVKIKFELLATSITILYNIIICLLLFQYELRRSRVIGDSFSEFRDIEHDRNVCVEWELGVLCIIHVCVGIGTSMALKVNESKSQE